MFRSGEHGILKSNSINNNITQSRVEANEIYYFNDFTHDSAAKRALQNDSVDF